MGITLLMRKYVKKVILAYIDAVRVCLRSESTANFVKENLKQDAVLYTLLETSLGVKYLTYPDVASVVRELMVYAEVQQVLESLKNVSAHKKIRNFVQDGGLGNAVLDVFHTLLSQAREEVKV